MTMYLHDQASECRKQIATKMELYLNSLQKSRDILLEKCPFPSKSNSKQLFFNEINICHVTVTTYNGQIFALKTISSRICCCMSGILNTFRSSKQWPVTICSLWIIYNSFVHD